MTDKIDLKRHVHGYAAKAGQFRILEVAPAAFLMIDGQGDPNTRVFAEAVEALYPLAYTIKFATKRELGRDYGVAPLEGLWWSDDMAAFTAHRDKARWSWTLMILQPDWIGAGVVDAARNAVRAKGAPPRLDDIRFEVFDEGLCVQTLHIGSFDDEGPVLARMHDEFIPAEGLRMTGRHHEIYLSEPRRTAPQKLRTILRQPVEREPVEREPVARSSPARTRQNGKAGEPPER